MTFMAVMAFKPAVVRNPWNPSALPGQSAAKDRLSRFNKKHIMDKKDALIMLVISGIYAVVAFTNLGAFQIPSSGLEFKEGTTLRLEFSQDEKITQMKYYAGFGQEVFSLSASEDGNQYSPVLVTYDDETKTEMIHSKDMLYKWHVLSIDVQSRYLVISTLPDSPDVRELSPGKLDMLEIAFYDQQGNLVEPVNVTGGADALFDEQQLVPAQPTYMTDFYFDELYHVRTAYENIHGIFPYETTHPPLGKIIIASGIEMFGMNPFGWRFMGTLTGVIMLPVMYTFAKLIFKKRRYAVFATILLAADFMHFAQTRIGTVDSYSILWIMLMYLFMFMYAQTNFNRQGVKPTLVPLFLCGLFFGIGAATKWLCIYAGFGLLAIFLIMMYKRWNADLCDDALAMASEYGKPDANSIRQCYYLITKAERHPQPLDLGAVSLKLNYRPNLTVYDTLTGGEA